jgi:hypothetical protein
MHDREHMLIGYIHRGSEVMEISPTFSPSLGCCNGIGFHTEACPLNPTGKILVWSDAQYSKWEKDSLGFSPTDSASEGTK